MLSLPNTICRLRICRALSLLATCLDADAAILASLFHAAEINTPISPVPGLRDFWGLRADYKAFLTATH
jgi:hypothetical protein